MSNMLYIISAVKNRTEYFLLSFHINSGGYKRVDKILCDFHKDAHLQFKLSLNRNSTK